MHPLTLRKAITTTLWPNLQLYHHKDRLQTDRGKNHLPNTIIGRQQRGDLQLYIICGEWQHTNKHRQLTQPQPGTSQTIWKLWWQWNNTRMQRRIPRHHKNMMPPTSLSPGQIEWVKNWAPDAPNNRRGGKWHYPSAHLSFTQNKLPNLTTTLRLQITTTTHQNNDTPKPPENIITPPKSKWQKC